MNPNSVCLLVAINNSKQVQCYLTITQCPLCLTITTGTLINTQWRSKNNILGSNNKNCKDWRCPVTFQTILSNTARHLSMEIQFTTHLQSSNVQVKNNLRLIRSMSNTGKNLNSNLAIHSVTIQILNKWIRTVVSLFSNTQLMDTSIKNKILH